MSELFFWVSSTVLIWVALFIPSFFFFILAEDWLWDAFSYVAPTNMGSDSHFFGLLLIPAALIATWMVLT